MVLILYEVPEKAKPTYGESNYVGAGWGGRGGHRGGV